VPSPMDRIVLFAGLLECVEEDGLNRVHRRLEFCFARPLSWVLDPLMRRWPAKDVPAEMAGAVGPRRLSQHGGRQAVAGRALSVASFTARAPSTAPMR
jgi:hypothetical protein